MCIAQWESGRCPPCSAIIQLLNLLVLYDLVYILQYYLEKNLDARMRELEREAELEEKAPKIKAKSKMSKVSIVVIITSIMKQERK